MSFKMVGFPASKMHREVDDGLTRHAKYKFVIHRLLNFCRRQCNEGKGKASG